jgi:hypothetical protein
MGNELVSLGAITLGSNEATAPGALWFSHDDGKSWELSTRDSPKVHGDLATNGAVLVAVGQGSAPDQSEVWVSRDGTSWQQAQAQELERSTINAVAATSDRFLAVGTRHNEDGTTSAMTWESVDGEAWEATAIATPGRFTDVVAGPPALVAVGDIGKGDGSSAPTVLLAAQSFNLNGVQTTFGGSATAVASGPLGIVIGSQILPDKLRMEAWFLPSGNARDAVETARDIGGFDDLVALPDRFIGLSHCPPTADCFASSFISIGRPVAAASPEPTAEACAFTPITKPPGKPDDGRLWMNGGEGLWAIVSGQVIDVSEHGIKVLWMSDEEMRGPMTVEVTSVGSSNYRKSYRFDGETLSGIDHPSGFDMPPPGCYRFSAQVGTVSGQIILEITNRGVP